MAQNPPPPPSQPMKCGGPTDSRQLEKNEQTLFDKYRTVIEQKVQEQFQVPKDFKLEPTKVQTQVVAGTNYYFLVPLPSKELARVRVFEPLQCNRQALASADPASFVTVEKETVKE